MRNSILALLILSVPAIASADTPKRSTIKTLEVTSSAFKNNEAIPTEYTCDGAELAPPLSWTKVPAATRSIAILVDDPDVPRRTFTHWLVTDIPPTTTSIDGALPEGAMAANNDKGSPGYAGPCPPAGRHHYQFRVYALDINMPRVTTRGDFLTAATGHVLASGRLVGTYERKANR